MVYCSHCGDQVADEAYFCPKCGTKTETGKTANVSYPTGELQDAFYRVGTELERAFTIAAHETHQALKKASENLQKNTQNQKSPAENDVICPNCGARNVLGAVFCYNCGKNMNPETPTS